MRKMIVFATMVAIAAASSAARAQDAPANCKNPDWKHVPTRDQLVSIWPRAALEKGLNGKAEITCTTTTQGSLRDCTVVREAPPGAGFGQAAIALSPQFLMTPKMCGGRPVQGDVQIPVNFTGLTGPSTLAGAPTGSRIPVQSPDDQPSLIDRPVWVEAPTYEQVVAAYPMGARASKTPGHVALRCSFGGDGRLRGCDVISEVPTGRGFGAAAQTLSRHFVGAATDLRGRKVRDNFTVVAFTFDPAMLSGSSPVVGKPQWTHVPQSVDLAASFPAAATAAHVSVGHVTMACDVGSGGRLENCAVSRQSPDGLGFDKAALALSSVFQVTVWTDEGLPTVGGHIVAPIRYEASADAAAPNGRQ
jgi:TonB family protein